MSSRSPHQASEQMAIVYGVSETSGPLETTPPPTEAPAVPQDVCNGGWRKWPPQTLGSIPHRKDKQSGWRPWVM